MSTSKSLGSGRPGNGTGGEGVGRVARRCLERFINEAALGNNAVYTVPLLVTWNEEEEEGEENKRS